ncbi:MAG: 50S ribosomal protein L18 [Bacteroidales bacterium]|nr:50S ribosomal protein L18 [Lentimicrobiaceae bacterium]MDD5695516.1 50S ribosomal protein L18 [Bacteroidales bacterium]
MSINSNKEFRRSRIRMRIRKVVKGTANRPRLSVFRSNRDIYVQLVDDLNGRTLLAVSSRQPEIADQKVNKMEQARQVGLLIGKKALEAGISDCVFDRGGYLYHGRVKSLADAAREGGLKF